MERKAIVKNYCWPVQPEFLGNGTYQSETIPETEASVCSVDETAEGAQTWTLHYLVKTRKGKLLIHLKEHGPWISRIMNLS